MLHTCSHTRREQMYTSGTDNDNRLSTLGNSVDRRRLLYHSHAVSGGLWLWMFLTGSTEDGANVQLWSPNAADCQLWSFQDAGEGYYNIISKRSDKALDIEGGSLESTANLQQNILSNAINQQFELELVSTYIFPTDGYVKWESMNMRGKYIRHANGVGRMDSYLTNTDDGLWDMVPGLAGEGVSFQSKNYPTNYFCNVNGELLLKEDDGSDEFDQKATFIETPGRANENLTSFQSYLYSDRYIRHRNNVLYVETVTTDLDKKDATFEQIGSRSGTSTAANPKNTKHIERVNLYPNPVSDIITISGLATEKKEIQVKNVYGDLMLSLVTNGLTLNISSLPDGIYFIQISTQKSKVYIRY